MRAEILRLASEMARRGEPFALATVVRREPPVSAQTGDTALITEHGTFHGWVGGACTQPAVRREALQALADGQPRLIALSPEAGASPRRGVTALPMTCHSGGSVDIYLEPVLPAPRVVLFGTSPTSKALARLASAMGYAVDAVDPEADRGLFPEADHVVADAAALQVPSAAARSGLFAIVATLGRWDEEATEAALGLEPAYVAVVASGKRFTQVRETLRARGVRDAALDRIKNPAGLDIGAQTPEEIALSILAEMVKVRRATPAATGVAAGAAAAVRPQAARAPGLDGPAPAAEALDPVCGMTVAVASARHRADHAGETFYFCCGGCRERFVADPMRYAAVSPR